LVVLDETETFILILVGGDSSWVDVPLILGVEFLNKAFASEREQGFFAPSPGGGGPYGGPFLIERRKKNPLQIGHIKTINSSCRV
jgi:hypothetical protein